MEVERRPVLGYPNYLAGSDGHVYSIRTGKPLSPRKHSRTEHLRVRLYGPRAPVRKHYEAHRREKPGPRFIDIFVHHVICTAWHGPRPDWADLVRHLDDCASNNRPGNLAWGTYDDNAKDRQWLEHVSQTDVNALEREGFALAEDPAFCYVPDEALGF